MITRNILDILIIMTGTKIKLKLTKNQESDKENAILKRLNKKARTELFRGELDQIVTNEDMARLTKFAKQGKQKEITLIKNANGEMATTPEEAVNNLCAAHFPTPSILDDESKDYKITTAAAAGQIDIVFPEYLSVEILRKAINTFGSRKSPGLDGITPEQMKLFDDDCLKLLRHIYACQLSLGSPTEQPKQEQDCPGHRG